MVYNKIYVLCSNQEKIVEVENKEKWMKKKIFYVEEKKKLEKKGDKNLLKNGLFHLF